MFSLPNCQTLSHPSIPAALQPSSRTILEIRLSVLHGARAVPQRCPNIPAIALHVGGGGNAMCLKYASAGVRSTLAAQISVEDFGGAVDPNDMLHLLQAEPALQRSI